MAEGTKFDFPAIKEFLTAAAGTGFVEAAKAIFGRVGKGASEDLRKIRFATLGDLSLEDEYLYERAAAELNSEEPNIVIALERKLHALESHQQNYYRLIIIGYRDESKDREEDDRRRVAVAKQLMRRHAVMNEAQWERWVGIMDIRRHRPQEQLKRVADVARNLSANIQTAADDQLTSLANARARLGAFNKRLRR